MTIAAASRPTLSNAHIDHLSQRLPAHNLAEFQSMAAPELDYLQKRSYERLHELQQEVDRLLNELRATAARMRSRQTHIPASRHLSSA
ncbi:hypothetical protein DUZ99_12410 [Xylanibacillus composti]|uniref:Uncharacterized protein n=1 Tax=Xylanibacillus composti TaxID=1572762 RepID=A0A8J4H146_9BACL|nr:hypothetical protein [Xylanibacillus composti]MDT9725774.1 hypothetical protein [Xylanibacillus composti]GIQ67512.1 hypothetical protein XYCOK13_03360 [Xylanibacillus composti]